MNANNVVVPGDNRERHLRRRSLPACIMIKRYPCSVIHGATSKVSALFPALHYLWADGIQRRGIRYTNVAPRDQQMDVLSRAIDWEGATDFQVSHAKGMVVALSGACHRFFNSASVDRARDMVGQLLEIRKKKWNGRWMQEFSPARHNETKALGSG